MIYFDNSATTIVKPPEVAEAVKFAISNFGNAGRSFYEAALLAHREVHKTRMEIADLIGLDDPLNIAFTSSATESLNLVIGGLVKKGDSVITTITEHNSVLRPLYLTGGDLTYVDCNDSGVLNLESLEKMITPLTKYVVCTHGSNVTGNITDVQKLYNICKSNGIILILDVSQTLGVIPVDIKMADILCFTGHKGLFGPHGTGGVIVNGKFNFSIIKTGGTGVNSFDMFQPSEMPDVFETGTLNVHSIYGLQKGVSFVNKTKIDTIYAKKAQLINMFYNDIKNIDRVRIYGDFSSEIRLPIISINIDGLTSSELAEELWTTYGIATRPGVHCAPLLHKRFGTADIGMVRFSFSYFNNENEIKKAIIAIKRIANNRL